MNNKKIRTFQKNIRRIIILDAIIPVFCIAVICLLLFFAFNRYMVKHSAISDNQMVSSEIERSVTVYEDAVMALARKDEIDWSDLNADQLVDIKRTMYGLTKGTGYRAGLFVLDTNLQPVITDCSAQDTFLKENINPKVGILYAMDQNPEKLVHRITIQKEPYLCMGTKIQKDNFQGYIIAAIKASEFEPLLSKISQQTVITDSRGWVLLANHFEFIDSLGRFDRACDGKSGKINYKAHTYYQVCRKIANLRVYTISNQDMRTKMNRILGAAVVIIFVMITLITCLVSGKVAKRSTSDIDVMSKAFEQVKLGRLDQYLSIHSSIEFQEIGEAYNMMLDGLKQNIEEKKELAEHAAFAQVKQLEAQFNPHFLFNTLDNIRFMSMIDSKKADQMIVSLSGLLRYSINTSAEEITVQEELKFTQSYLDILKIRFNRRFVYEISVDENAYDCRIPKLLIQPLIENAVKYGMGEKDQLTVCVEGKIVEDDLVVICQDDGAGMDKERLVEIQEILKGTVNRSGYYGLYNIQRRIQLMYGPQYGIIIQSQKGEGTKLTLRLPVHRHEGGEPC